MAQQDSLHPKLPLGLGSQVTLTGFIGGIVAFITAWSQNGLNGETVGIGASTLGLIAVWYAGRSVQAKAAIDAAVGSYQAPPPDLGNSGSAELP